MTYKVSNQAAWEGRYIIVNHSKGLIFDPADITLKAGSSIMDIALTAPKFGNSFQLEFFHLLRDDWKGDRIDMLELSEEGEEAFVEETGYTYYKKFKFPFKSKIQITSFGRSFEVPKMRAVKMMKDWKEILGKYILINYDYHLYMTIDQRLFDENQDLMPYFGLVYEKNSQGSWSSCRIGLEKINSKFLEEDVYLEMFRRVGDKTAIQLNMEELLEEIKERQENLDKL